MSMVVIPDSNGLLVLHSRGDNWALAVRDQAPVLLRRDAPVRARFGSAVVPTCATRKPDVHVSCVCGYWIARRVGMRIVFTGRLGRMLGAMLELCDDNKAEVEFET